MTGRPDDDKNAAKKVQVPLKEISLPQRVFPHNQGVRLVTYAPSKSPSSKARLNTSGKKSSSPPHAADQDLNTVKKNLRA